MKQSLIGAASCLVFAGTLNAQPQMRIVAKPGELVSGVDADTGPWTHTLGEMHDDLTAALPRISRDGIVVYHAWGSGSGWPYIMMSRPSQSNKLIAQVGSKLNYNFGGIWTPSGYTPLQFESIGGTGQQINAEGTPTRLVVLPHGELWGQIDIVECAPDYAECFPSVVHVHSMPGDNDRLMLWGYSIEWGDPGETGGVGLISASGVSDVVTGQQPYYSFFGVDRITRERAIVVKGVAELPLYPLTPAPGLQEIGPDEQAQSLVHEVLHGIGGASTGVPVPINHRGQFLMMSELGWSNPGTAWPYVPNRHVLWCVDAEDFSLAVPIVRDGQSPAAGFVWNLRTISSVAFSSSASTHKYNAAFVAELTDVNQAGRLGLGIFLTEGNNLESTTLISQVTTIGNAGDVFLGPIGPSVVQGIHSLTPIKSMMETASCAFVAHVDVKRTPTTALSTFGLFRKSIGRPVDMLMWAGTTAERQWLNAPGLVVSPTSAGEPIHRPAVNAVGTLVSKVMLVNPVTSANEDAIVAFFPKSRTPRLAAKVGQVVDLGSGVLGTITAISCMYSGDHNYGSLTGGSAHDDGRPNWISDDNEIVFAAKLTTAEGSSGPAPSSAVLTVKLTHPCNPADIANSVGLPWPDGVVNEGDYNAFFQYFFAASPSDLYDDIADSVGSPWPDGVVNEGDYNAFFQFYFGAC